MTLFDAIAGRLFVSRKNWLWVFDPEALHTRLHGARDVCLPAASRPPYCDVTERTRTMPAGIEKTMKKNLENLNACLQLGCCNLSSPTLTYKYEDILPCISLVY